MRAPSKLGRVIFIRHGESIWNVTDPSRGLVTRFTGWADVPLTERGRYQAAAAGRCLKAFDIKADAVFTSLLSRSKETYKEILKVIPSLQTVPVINSWRLNERHYGALVGLSKDEAGKKLGDAKVMEWRRSWDLAPPPMDQEDLVDLSHVAWGKPMTVISHPGKQQIVTIEKGISVPRTESLADCAKRVWPLWMNGIAPRVARGETVLIVAHANSIRSIVKHIDNDTMTVETVRDVHIPSAIPLVYSFEAREPINGSASSIKPMGEPTALGMSGRYIATKEVVSLALESPKGSNKFSFHLEDSHGNDDSISSFYDLMDKGLTDIIEYSDAGKGSNDALIVTDGNGVIVHSNRAWEQLCGFHIDEIRGKTNKFLQGPLTCDAKIAALNQSLQSGLAAKTSVINYRKNGNAFDNKLTIIPVYGGGNSQLNMTSQNGNSDDADNINSRINESFNGSNYDLDRFDASVNSTAELDHRSVDSTYQIHSFAQPKPSHFVARLEVTPDLPDLPPLSPEQMEMRGLSKRNSQVESNIGNE